LAQMPPDFIRKTLDTLKPHAARNWLKAIRHLMQFAVEHGFARTDPTQGVRARVRKSDGHHTWTEEEVARYEAHYPIGTKARLAFALGAYTGCRRSDVILLGPQHVRNGEITVRQQKTGEPVWIEVLPPLQEILDATASGHLTFLVTRSGQPYRDTDFSEQFRAWCDAAGL